jgi:hypothetical protein
VTPPRLSLGRWPGPPTKIVVRISNKLLVYCERAIKAVHAQMAYSIAHTDMCADALWRIAKAGTWPSPCRRHDQP